MYHTSVSLILLFYLLLFNLFTGMKTVGNRNLLSGLTGRKIKSSRKKSSCWYNDKEETIDWTKNSVQQIVLDCRYKNALKC